MRQHLAAALVAIAALAGSARADPKPKPIDVAKMRDKLDVYRDDAGHYVVVPREGGDDAENWVFYGDGKAMYQQRVFGTGGSDEGLDFTMWSPRVSEQAGAQVNIVNHPGSGGPRSRVSCGPKDERTLSQLPADQAKAMMARATFLQPLWQRGAQLIARDDEGTYYFVDAFRDEVGGGGHRLFIGKKAGQMKEQVLTHVVSDPAGDVFTTKDGSIKTFGGGSDKPPVWRHGDKTTELTVLDITDPRTRLIIYRDFAIYGALGTPCD